MKRIIGTAIGLCLLAGSQALAQAPEKKAVETTTKQTGPGATLTTETQSVTGTVQSYEAGKKIKLSGPNDKSYAFDLSENARLDGAIVIGQMATVKYSKGTDGKETVLVISNGNGTANALSAADAPKMHSESTVKSTGPAGTTKTKTEMVIGTVKEYEAGKSIKVTGPNDKDFSFDLTDMVPLKTAVTIGERVKVTFTKSNNGDKATTIVAHPAKA